MPSKTSKGVEVVLAYDLGGTKVAVGAVDSRGRVLEEIREPVVIERGKAAVLAQLADLGKRVLKSQSKKIRRAGIASAGPLDPKNGDLLDPTNFVSAEGRWGRVPIAKILSKALKIPFTLENDAAAAVLAEHWVGAARGKDNVLILTLGTGLGTGMLVNGELARAGRGLHPEGGHVILRSGDTTAPCGCGNLGCSEAFLSGRAFTRRTRAKLSAAGRSATDKLDGAAIAELARSGDATARAAFDEYALLLAQLIHNLAVLYTPEIVVLTGSFAAASDLFLDSARTELERLLTNRRKPVDLLPKITLSNLDNQAGLIGGAFIALHPPRHPKP